MILLTGGAGFIGSNLHAALHARGENAVVVDWLGSNGQWRNLGAHPPARIVAPEALDAYLATDPAIDLVFHLGAISETTATDGDLVWNTNVELSWRLWQWCTDKKVRLIYASSASTYGAPGKGALRGEPAKSAPIDSDNGFDDDPAVLPSLRPLNLYGWSKHAFDLRVQAALRNGEPAPPQWAGLKFFNVYGPNEYHKGPMVSVVKVKFDEVAAGRPPRLFQSDQPGLPDGHQARDFIWIDDIVDVLLWLLDTPTVSGLFNLGTGQARTYQDLAYAVCDAAGVPRAIEFIPMPERLRGQYQSFTQARMDRLRAAGYPGQFTTLEAGIHRYVTQYLATGDLYR